MPRVAVLKPDHLGDLVLASPAIRALCRTHQDVTLFVNPASRGLAGFLFGGAVEVRTVNFRHLARGGADTIEPELFARKLMDFAVVYCLRDDLVMSAVMAQLSVPHYLAGSDHYLHETAAHQRCLVPIIGDYSRTALFSTSPIVWPASVTRVGLCISAGFPTNQWPLTHWLELANELSRHGLAIDLIGGPREQGELRLLSRLLSRVPHRVAVGGDDFSAFLDALEPMDLIIATDSGTAHICSLRKPICSIFGSSPWRRYAPFGRDNLLLTRDEVCSPCLQFSSTEVNGCLTRECMTALPPRQVARAVLSSGNTLPRVRQLRVERGVSHRAAA